MTTGRTRNALLRFLSPPPVRRLGAVLAAVGLLAILTLTLIPDQAQAPYSRLTPLLCVICGAHGGADMFLNVPLFIPFAAGLRLAGWSWVRVVITSALLSFAVEFLQYTVITGRDASLSDLVTNTTGAAVGATIAPHLLALAAPGRARAARLFAAGIGLWIGVLAASAVALRPWVPPGTIRNDCSRSLGKVETFAGTVRSVVLNGVPLPCDADIPEETRLRRELSRGDVDLEATMPSWNPHVSRVLYHAVRGTKRYLLILDQQGRAATFTPPTAGNRLGFYSPVLRLAEAFPADSGVPVRLHAAVHQQRLRLASEAAAQGRSVEIALSPAHGWAALLVPAIQPDSRFRLATAIWMALLILPAAYWGGLLGRPRLALAGGLAALGAGLGLLPLLAGYPPVHWSEWLGGLTGLAAGWALSSFAGYLQSRCGSPSTSGYSSP